MLKKIIHRKLILSAIILLISCNCFFIHNEMVMINGMKIDATNEHGNIVIEAGKGKRRYYIWDDYKVSYRLVSRTSRWDGGLGAYLPGSGGKIYAVLEEGQQHFSTEEDIYPWLDWQADRLKWVYTSDGLVVGWLTTEGPGENTIALTVNVWQLYIKGEKPKALKGARNDLVKVTYKYDNLLDLPEPGDFIPHEVEFVNGRWYSGKALDYMKENKISHQQVEQCIATGDRIPDEKYNIYCIDRPFIIVTVNQEGKVVLVNG